MTDNTSRARMDVKNVAVIGAGWSGVNAAGHLLRQGLNVTIFERSAAAGGVWRFDTRTDLEPAYPSLLPPSPDEFRRRTQHLGDVENEHGDKLERLHAPPGPCYEGLQTNVPTTLMRSTLQAWPEGTTDYTDHWAVEKYILATAESTGVDPHTQYNTSVQSVVKSGNSWTVETKTLKKSDRDNAVTFDDKTWRFDAVVVAAGHYHVPRIPEYPGLKGWKEKAPSSVFHSKSYRNTDPFKDKTVFLLGAGVSCYDIAKHCVGIAKKVYQSTRDGAFDLPRQMMPDDMERVGPVARFEAYEDGSGSGNVWLQNGDVVRDVDIIVLGTGYITSYPFLESLQDPSKNVADADDRIIITSDGYMTHNLHLDLFYIPDPTLAFVGVPYHASSFSLFEFQGEVIARVFASKAELPSKETLRSLYETRKSAVENAGLRFHSLGRKDLAYMLEHTKWMNEEAERLGVEPMAGPDEEFIRNYNEFLEKLKARGFGPQGKDKEEVKVNEEGDRLQDQSIALAKVETAEAIA